MLPANVILPVERIVNLSVSVPNTDDVILKLSS